MPMGKRLLVTVLAVSAIVMGALQPANSQTNAPTDTHACPPYAYYNPAAGQCVLITRQSLR